MLGRVATFESTLKSFARRQLHSQRIAAYLRSNRRPWSYGYGEYKAQYLRNFIGDEAFMESMKRGDPLPPIRLSSG